jgi:hypothetical protein
MAGELLIYSTEDGRSRVECRFDGETIWLTQALMAELFQTTPQNITLHLKNIYADGELNPNSTIREFRIVQIESHSRALGSGERSTGKQSLQVEIEPSRGVERLVKHYHLEAILAVGYRVRSARGVQFRRWATERLSEYLVKGFTMDDERLRNPPAAGHGVPDYFDELLARIRDIRASERRMYLRVQEIFTMAADYGTSPPDTRFRRPRGYPGDTRTTGAVRGGGRRAGAWDQFDEPPAADWAALQAADLHGQAGPGRQDRAGREVPVVLAESKVLPGLARGV